MKLTTKGRYGLNAMYDLAASEGEGPQSVKAISQRQNIPEAYLEQLICSLKKAGLVVSVRGAQGGYRIARSAGEISIGDILRALEGEVLQIECLADEEFCANACSCPSRRVFRRLAEGMNQLVDSISLADMIAGDCENTPE